MNRTARRMNRQLSRGRRTTGRGCPLTLLCLIALVALSAVLLAGCKAPDDRTPCPGGGVTKCVRGT